MNGRGTPPPTLLVRQIGTWSNTRIEYSFGFSHKQNAPKRSHEFQKLEGTMKTMWTLRLRRPVLTAAVLGAALSAVLLAIGFLLLQGSGDNSVRAGDSSEHGSITVRIAAMRTDSGAVRVAAQSVLANGEWSERVLPSSRVIRADVESGRWLHSSPIELPIPGGDDGAHEATADSTVDQDSPGPLFCLVSHGSRTDHFWRLLRGNARQAALDSDLNLRIYSSPAGED